MKFLQVCSPWLDIALDLARSILFPTNIQQRDLNKSMSCKRVRKYSARVNEALSTTEKKEKEKGGKVAIKVLRVLCVCHYKLKSYKARVSF